MDMAGNSAESRSAIDRALLCGPALTELKSNNYYHNDCAQLSHPKTPAVMVRGDIRGQCGSKSASGRPLSRTTAYESASKSDATIAKQFNGLARRSASRPHAD
jgi:hypothetical protein